MRNDTRNVKGVLRDSVSEQTPRALYVHIPFCRSRCFYCDFTTYVAPAAVVDGYVHHLLQEIHMIAPMVSQPLESIFFGGGTPTFLSVAQWETLLQGLANAVPISPDAEITVEANPGTVTAEKLAVLRSYGVNRISFGAQTMSDRLLMSIGRLHDAEAVHRSITLAKEAGFRRISMDLMFGLPEQTMEDVQQAIQAVGEFGLSHVSAYWLKVEPGTPFADWQNAGLLPLPGEDDEAEMYDEIRRQLHRHGLVQYEVSNFAVPGEASRHNLVYWRNHPYFAVGVGAHGYVYGKRHENVTSLTKYASLLSKGERPFETSYGISAAESAENTVMLGLRLAEGVPLKAFEERHGVPLLDLFADETSLLLQQGMLELTGGVLRLTERAWPIANAVFERFVGVLPTD